LLVIDYRKIYVSNFDYRLYDIVEINRNVYIIGDIIDFPEHREYHILKMCENMREILEYSGDEFDDYVHEPVNDDNVEQIINELVHHWDTPRHVEIKHKLIKHFE